MDASARNTWIVAGLGTLAAATLGYFGYKRWAEGPADKKETREDEKEREKDKDAEDEQNIVLPSSLSQNFNVRSAKITAITTQGIDVEVIYVHNAGYDLVPSGIPELNDIEDGYDTAWDCWDYNRCDVNAMVSYVPIASKHARNGAGLTPEETIANGTVKTMTLSFPSCTRYCSNDETYGGTLRIQLVDPNNPQRSSSVTRADGKPLNYVYGEEANSSCLDGVDSTWFREVNMCTG
jgi:hypothetical protein